MGNINLREGIHAAPQSVYAASGSGKNVNPNGGMGGANGVGGGGASGSLQTLNTGVSSPPSFSMQMSPASLEEAGYSRSGGIPRILGPGSGKKNYNLNSD